MEDVHSEDDVATQQASVGTQLREAREAAGMELEQVAAETRIPQRHLVSIEQGDFAALPSRTYAIGFSRTYARLLDLDDREVTDRVRAELASTQNERPERTTKLEPGDPARVPGRGLAWFGLIAAVLLIGGIYAFYSSYFSPGLGPAPLQEPEAQVAQANGRTASAPAQASASPAPTGPVVFTSTMDGTWVKFYDANGERLYEAQMDEGDTYTIPSDAEGPQVWTGRPYALAITVGGREVPRLSEEDEIIRDVPVSPEALLARGENTAAPKANEAGTAAAPATT
ncbi:helix-turn-helix domain-containing protein [Erythrobacter litoralis]|uniref:helix-turn-helix domain-containing protein n=1 Tax=Erythrobacter litoralis TaxID=39960 RepID=UPI0024350017|nr:helix-turn-helix domain-containing protein [Erythrobacter litoralis]MDG6077821.1 helix-turn-helix domain-containing protein [Erythrobacter litoralis]